MTQTALLLNAPFAAPFRVRRLGGYLVTLALSFGILLLTFSQNPLSAQNTDTDLSQPPSSNAVSSGPWITAGGFAIAPQFGDIRLLRAVGEGSAENPLVLDVSHHSPGPVRLHVQNLERGENQPGLTYRFQFVSIVVRVVNRSARVWIGYEFELQAQAGAPSDYWDGLSFNQPSQLQSYGGFSSDRFAVGERIAEPSDRLRFYDGVVNDGEGATFRIVVTDTTPARDFYIVLEPLLVFA